MISRAQLATAAAAPSAGGASARGAGAPPAMLRVLREPAQADAPLPALKVHPADIVERRMSSWGFLSVESIQAIRHQPLAYEYRAPVHMLIAYERGSRSAGETSLGALPPSNLRDFSQRLTFVPAGVPFHERQTPRTLLSAVVFYIDPRRLLLDPRIERSELALAPRLFFEHAALWQTAHKLKMLVGGGGSANARYAEALGAVLAHELVRLSQAAPSPRASARGTLCGWQKRVVADYIDGHLDEPISLATLAGLARLSPFHFARAFKQSFGVPPHCYHTSRRIDRAKALLASPSHSVTNIAIDVGFTETSSFTKAFRKLAGVTPTQYRQSIGGSQGGSRTERAAYASGGRR
jgi:AraC family transcriptional regulator